MQSVPPRRAFQTLDGLRGVGALLVVVRHVPEFFGPIRVPESFLAVDLFYLISGFVVAHAYGARLRAGGYFVEFIKVRLIRLYPLYAFGLALGLVVAGADVIFDPSGWWTPVKLGEAVVTGALMIPLFPGLGANGSSLDGPTWTLLPELVANMVYAAAIRFMTTWVLLAIVAVCGAGLVVAEVQYGTLDVGYDPTDFWAALARGGFSFFAGVLIYRLIGERRIGGELAAWACVAVVTVVLACSPSEAAAPYVELAAVMVGFPALLAIAAQIEPSARTGRVFAYTGLLSYGVYVLHKPLSELAWNVMTQWIDVPEDWSALAYGAVFLVVLTGLAAALDRYYDGPVRRVIRGLAVSKRCLRN